MIAFAMIVGGCKSDRREGSRSRLTSAGCDPRTSREIRRKLEAELFHDRYRLVSKNDDDLPIVR